jgi:hypothetical protein
MYRVFADRAIHAAALSHGDTQAARIFFASVLLVMSLGEAAVRLWHLWRWNMPLLDDGCRPAGDPTPITLDPNSGGDPRKTISVRRNETRRCCYEGHRLVGKSLADASAAPVCGIFVHNPRNRKLDNLRPPL